MTTFPYADLVTSIVDYPKEGIIFRDITTLLQDAEGFKASVDCMVERFKDAGVTKVVGSEARGFIFGAPVAYQLGAGFIPARKPGKLPREVVSQEYLLEYGKDMLEVHLDAIEPGDVVLVIDDLIATGGTAIATAKLVQEQGAKLAGMAFAIELPDLKGREKIAEALGDLPVYSVMEFEGE